LAFAAIRRHNEAWRAFGDACKRTDEVRARNEDREVTDADEDAWTAALRAEEGAFEALINLPPVTVPFPRAAIHYFTNLDTDCIPCAAEKFLTALLASPVLAIGRA
jgi:hypothetical protein